MENPTPPQGNTWNTLENDFVELSSGKLESLKEVIREIEELVVERQRLSLAFIKDGDHLKTDIKNFLTENAPKGEDDSEFAKERAELRKKQMEISESQMKERIDCWKDIALLKKELREREKELIERESRTEMIEKILEE